MDGRRGRQAGWTRRWAGGGRAPSSTAETGKLSCWTAATRETRGRRSIIRRQHGQPTISGVSRAPDVADEVSSLSV